MLHAEHFTTGDLDGLVDAYTDSVVVRPAGMAPVHGRAALRTTVKAWLAAAPIRTLEYTTEDLAVFGDTTFQIASFTGTVQPPGSAEAPYQGSCAVLWVHDARNGWKIARSMCNSSLPPAEAQ